MRYRLNPLPLFAAALLAVSAPAFAVDRSQSYLSYEDGGATVVQAFDNRRIDAHRNVPLFPGDEVETSRRGRIEISLADGNVVAVDRSSRIALEALAYNYDSPDATETLVRLDYGQVIVHRPDESSDAPVRLDTSVASYAGSEDSIFSVETGARGREVLSVFSGVVEVRTRDSRERVRMGEQVSIDDDGIYGSNVVVRGGTSEFERWYLERADRYGRGSSRYLPAELSRYEDDFDRHGRWVYIGSYGGYVWRPFVDTSWRPYHQGYWGWSPSGAVWISNEPWGWAPYHYGRWTLAPGYGWVWLPGNRYSHAWVYWMYGPSYIGWVPAGWYDCHPNYWNWRYRPHYTSRVDVGFGFHGRVRGLRDMNLEGWTLVDSRTFYSNRADQASLGIDEVRNRFARHGDSAVFSSVSARFDSRERANPAEAVERIARVGLDRSSVTGRDSSGSLADLTPFVRRDPELSPDLRERVSRTRDGGSVSGRSGGSDAVVARPAASAGGGSSNIPSVGDRFARPGAGESTPGTPARRPAVIQRPGASSGSAGSGGGATAPRTPAIQRPTPGSSPSADGPAVRRPVIERPSSNTPRAATPTAPVRTPVIERPAVRAPETSSPPREQTWRRPERVDREGSAPDRSNLAPRSSTRSDQTPRRVIDSIRGGSDSSRTPSTRRESSTPSRGSVRVPRSSVTPTPGASSPSPRSSSPSRGTSVQRTPARSSSSPSARSSSSQSSDSSSSRSTNMKRPD